MAKKKRVDPYFMMLKPVPITDPNQNLVLGYAQPVIFSLSLFHGTMRRWIFDSTTVQHIYPQFKTFELLDQPLDVDLNVPVTEETSSNKCFSVIRALTPKRVHNELALERIDVEINWSSQSASYTFTPIRTNDATLPHMSYFQVHSFTINYEPIYHQTDHSLSVDQVLTMGIQNASISNPAPAVPIDYELTPCAIIKIQYIPLPTSMITAEIIPEENSVWEDLLSRAFKWTTHDMLGGYVPVAKDVLVNKPEFVILYKQLKKKYGYLLTTWTECTDPTKYVYEDIALTAYMTLLWTQVYGQKQAKECVVFADLGCGNGLLTFLLSKEGFLGYGIDSRQRKIWPRWRDECPSLQIIESTLDLQLYSLPTDVTWVIGNHADELCPWIPDISLRPRTKPIFSQCCKSVGQSIPAYLMILPCCYYNLSGVLFCPPKSTFPVPQHLESAVSRYKRYIQYIGEQCASKGYRVTYDALRIPSTKNQALICQHTSLPKKW